jgi:Uma2 family endonuclease
MPSESTARKLRLTWDDYRSWNDGKRWEIIGGVAYDMTPAPTTRHQKLQIRLAHCLEGFCDGKPCDVYPAPTDVKLSETDIVQPDLAVVCDRSQIKETHIEGAPTLVAEILSPSTEARDRGCKLDLYAEAGVNEVWLVKPYPWLIEVFVLTDAAYRRAGAYTEENTFASPTFPDLQLDLAKLFDLPIPPEERIRRVKDGPAEYVAAGT